MRVVCRIYVACLSIYATIFHKILNLQIIILHINTSGVGLPVVEAKPEAEEAASTTDADHFFFTIDGIPAGSEHDRLAPGIYIEHDHGKTRKFIKH